MENKKKACPVCQYQRKKEWAERNKEQLKRKKRLFYEENIDLCKERRRISYESRKEYCKAYYSAWRKRNKDKQASYGAARKASQIQRTPPWLTKTHKKQIQKFYSERDRLTAETKIIHEVDHIIPLRGKLVSGLHVPWNLQVITADENRRKLNRY